MRTAAVLPVKSFARAKQRLGGTVADPLRQALAAAMVTDVLEALAATAALTLTIVVTRERSIEAPARELGALVVEDPDESGQSAAASLGVRHALARGIEQVLCVPGDCPALDPAELQALLLREPAPPVVVIPDRHGTGTNGLLLSPPAVIAPSFGPDSCERHRALAADAGVDCRIERPSSLLLDVDTGADLRALRERLADQGDRAPRTRAVLAERRASGVGAAA